MSGWCRRGKGEGRGGQGRAELGAYSNGVPYCSSDPTSASGLRFFLPLPSDRRGYPKGTTASTSYRSGSPTFLATPSRPPKPVQLEPTPSAHAVRIIDWMARLASETPTLLAFS